MRQRRASIGDLIGQRTAFLLIELVVAGGLVLGSIFMVGWIWDRVRGTTASAAPSAIFKSYNPSGAYQQSADWVAAQQAYQTYVSQYPQPQNAQVLKGWSTAQIYGFMVSQVSGGLKVNCQYCHNVNNFAADENPFKVKARQMMLMAADINGNFVSKLPASVGGYQVTCATCHNGQPKNETYPVAIQKTLPNDFKVPLDRDYPGGLVVTGRTDIGLESVQLNQYTMYHFNVSLGQGCTFCHNSRHFPSNEVAQKNHAITMLQMAKHLQDTYAAPGGDLNAGIMNGRSISCWMCHRGARVPPGAAQPGQIPPQLTTAAPSAKAP